MNTPMPNEVDERLKNWLIKFLEDGNYIPMFHLPMDGDKVDKSKLKDLTMTVRLADLRALITKQSKAYHAAGLRKLKEHQWDANEDWEVIGGVVEPYFSVPVEIIDQQLEELREESGK